MRRSRTITLTVLGVVLVTACLTTSGCGRESAGSGSSGRSFWLWGGSGYRSYNSGNSYRSGTGTTSTITRGGFGRTGSSSSGS